MTDDQVEMLCDAIRYGLKDIGSGDAICTNTSPIETITKPIYRIASALERLADVAENLHL